MRRTHLVLCVLAALVAFTGTATAAATIGTRQVRDGGVTSADVRDRSVTGAEFRNRSVPRDRLDRRCPARSVPFGGLCAPLRTGAALPHPQAVALCDTRGGRLPTIAEAAALVLRPGVVWGDGGLGSREWVSTAYSAGAVSVTAAGEVADTDGAFEFDFRCLTPRTR